MFSLTLREKRLLVVLLIIIGFALWYKVFGGLLLPRYNSLIKELEPFSEIMETLPLIKEQQEEQEIYLRKTQSELEILHNSFSPNSGFLLTTLGKLSENKVIILRIEPKSTLNESFYQVQSMEVTISGEYGQVMNYLQELEKQSGIKIGSVELKTNSGFLGLVEAGFLIHHYTVTTGQEKVSIEPSSSYLPYGLYNPFENNFIEEIIEPWIEEDIEVNEEKEYVSGESQLEIMGSHEDLVLEPYTFPKR